MPNFDKGKLEEGDILLNEYDKGEWHALIYAAPTENRCFVDSTPNTNFNGVRFGAGNAMIKAYDEILDGGDGPGAIEVFRYTGKLTDLPKRAAGYARKWATNPEKGGDFYMATPYDDRRRYENEGGLAFVQRLEGAQGTKDNSLTGASMFRIVKAFIHASEDKPLSANRGVSCAMFATYCYQVAALETLYPHGSSTLSKTAETRAIRVGQRHFDTMKPEFEKFSGVRDRAKQGLKREKIEYRLDPSRKDEEIHQFLATADSGVPIKQTGSPSAMARTYLKAMGVRSGVTNKIPAALRIDAKMTSADDLRQALKRGQDFRELVVNEFTR